VRTDVAVLFDLDGVIIDSRPHHLSAWHQLALETELTHAPDYFTQTFGLRNEPIIRGLAPEITDSRLRELAERKEQLFRAAARGNLELLPGVLELLSFLDEQDVPKTVVTSAPRANLDMVVETLGIGRHFQALIAEEDAKKGKPDPEGFLVAARRVSVEPARSVVIEDAPAGLQAAKAGRMRAIGVTTTHPAPDLGAADLVVDSLAEEIVRRFILG
jgi:HAD superfamily hydrolase (TIGR01509 family)